jgi:hypothetical protein
MICTVPSPAVKRYNFRFIVLMLVYAAFLIPAVWAFKHVHPTGLLAYALAILPSLPIIAGLAVSALYLAEEKDEFQRAVLTQSMLWGIGVILTATTVWGFLENFLLVPRMDLYLVFPLFCFVVGIVSPILKARYR